MAKVRIICGLCNKIGVFVAFQSVFLRHFNRYFCGNSIGILAVRARINYINSPLIFIRFKPYPLHTPKRHLQRFLWVLFLSLFLSPLQRYDSGGAKCKFLSIFLPFSIFISVDKLVWLNLITYRGCYACFAIPWMFLRVLWRKYIFRLYVSKKKHYLCIKLYLSYKERLMRSLTSERCKELIRQTDELRKWIKSKL